MKRQGIVAPLGRRGMSKAIPTVKQGIMDYLTGLGSFVGWLCS